QPHAQLLDAGEETVEMQIEAEEAAIPHMHGVVGGVGMKKAPIEYRDLRLRQRQILPVHIGDALRVAHRVDMPFGKLWKPRMGRRFCRAGTGHRLTPMKRSSGLR